PVQPGTVFPAIPQGEVGAVVAGQFQFGIGFDVRLPLVGGDLEAFVFAPGFGPGNVEIVTHARIIMAEPRWLNRKRPWKILQGLKRRPDHRVRAWLLTLSASAPAESPARCLAGWSPTSARSPAAELPRASSRRA